MTEQAALRPSIGSHGATRLPAVTVEGYNAELRDEDDQFLGDRASNRALHDIIEELRARIREVDEDPLGDDSSEGFGSKKLDEVMKEGSLEARGVIQAATEAFSKELAKVIRRFLRLKAWRDVERLAVGGGLSGSSVGELAIGRTAIELKTAGTAIELSPIHHPPDEAGLVGAVQLAPRWVFESFDAILALDIGGTKMRAGVVQLNLEKTPDLSAACVWKYEVWRHRDEKPTRDQAVERLAGMLSSLAKRAEREGLRLAPFIGIGCPGMIQEDGYISRGAQNLPGNWETTRFNLPRRLHEAIPAIGGHETTVVMHNDAVVQGLSEVPFMQDVARWGIFTIGTGLGNAVFANRSTEAKG
ncbi:MAG: ROK family protein [Pseudomonadota bacterium]|nr:ROK family protein [Pseudomonadota bacterium]